MMRSATMAERPSDFFTGSRSRVAPHRAECDFEVVHEGFEAALPTPARLRYGFTRKQSRAAAGRGNLRLMPAIQLALRGPAELQTGALGGAQEHAGRKETVRARRLRLARSAKGVNAVR